jgi:hypothetical protein
VISRLVLRGGLSIFRERDSDSNLELREAEGYACGIVVIRYGNAREGKAKA